MKGRCASWRTPSFVLSSHDPEGHRMDPWGRAPTLIPAAVQQLLAYRAADVGTICNSCAHSLMSSVSTRKAVMLWVGQSTLSRGSASLADGTGQKLGLDALGRRAQRWRLVLRGSAMARVMAGQVASSAQGHASAGFLAS